MNKFFRDVSEKTSEIIGSPIAFAAAFGLIVIWAVLGPLFDFSQTWQLIINTWTTIITFLMVFLIQNTQNRDKRALYLKLDEMILVSREARNSMINVEKLPDEEQIKLIEEFEKVEN